MKIGELALLAGCQVATIRFFEAEGLLLPPSRTASNYRDYDQSHLDRLAFILRCRSFDMSHSEIRVLLELQDDPSHPCDEVNAMLDAHASLLNRRIEELRALRKQLQAIRTACSGGVCIGDCGALGLLRSTTGAKARA